MYYVFILIRSLLGNEPATAVLYPLVSIYCCQTLSHWCQ